MQIATCSGSPAVSTISKIQGQSGARAGLLVLSKPIRKQFTAKANLVNARGMSARRAQFSVERGVTHSLGMVILNRRHRKGEPQHLALHTREGYSITRTACPIAFGGMFFWNLARTTPFVP